MIIGVTASRSWKDKRQIADAFDLAAADFHDPAYPDILIEGGTSGGDALCRTEAIRRGWHPAMHEGALGYLRETRRAYPQ